MVVYKIHATYHYENGVYKITIIKISYNIYFSCNSYIKLSLYFINLIIELL